MNQPQKQAESTTKAGTVKISSVPFFASTLVQKKLSVGFVQ